MRECRHLRPHALWYLLERKGWNDRLPEVRNLVRRLQCYYAKRKRILAAKELVGEDRTRQLPMPISSNGNASSGDTDKSAFSDRQRFIIDRGGDHTVPHIGIVDHIHAAVRFIAIF